MALFDSNFVKRHRSVFTICGLVLIASGCSMFDQIEEVDQATLQREAVQVGDDITVSVSDSLDPNAKECAVLMNGLVAGHKEPAFWERGKCGNEKPLVITHLGGSNPIKFSKGARINCAMATQLQRWFSESVQPVALSKLGQPVRSVRVAASYSCRTRNSKRGAVLSEHAKMNAIDFSSFTLANGKTLTVQDDWRGIGREAKFMKAINRSACKYFTTVLGPGGDKYHQDHFHLDLARHGRKGAYRVCK